MTSCISKSGVTLGNALVSPWCMGGTRRPWKCCCVCSSSSTCISGAIKKRKRGSRTVSCCAGSAGWGFIACPMRARCGAGSRHCARRRCMRESVRVVQLARQAKVTKGCKLRLDATCVQTEIHHPTDSGLLVDSVRVLSRFVQRAKGLVKDQMSNVQQTCRSRLRSARQIAQTLHRQLRRKVEEKE